MNENSGLSIIFFVVYILFIILVLTSFWKIYVKAGRKGWEGIIPIYNIYVLMSIVGRPSWWFILYFIPLINLFITIIVSIDLAKSFGKGTAFGVIWLWALSIAGYPYLAFSNAKYSGPSVKPANNSQSKPAESPTQPTTPPVSTTETKTNG